MAGGTRFHAAVHGRPGQPLVVCVHGLACSHRYFGPFAQAMASDALVVAPDLPGFGRTPGPRAALDVRGLSQAFAAWLRATDRGGATLVANSAGCQVVVDMAVHAPELLGPVVLTGPTVDRDARRSSQQALRLLRDLPRERPSLPFVVGRDYLRSGVRRTLATGRHLLADPIERKLHLVHTPAIVARGEHDPIAPRDWTVQVARAMPFGHYVEVPDAAHALNYSAPEALARIVRRLMAS